MTDVEKSEIPHNCHTWKAEISPHDNYFSTNIIRDIRDKYQVWAGRQETGGRPCQTGTDVASNATELFCIQARGKSRLAENRYS